MPRVTIYNDDCRRVLRQLPEKSIHMVVSSPPYFGLRNYNTGQWLGGRRKCQHKNINNRCTKCAARYSDRGIGNEATPSEYVNKLVRIFRRVRRVLRDDGVIYLNLGDSYATGRSGNTIHTINKRGVSNSIENTMKRIANMMDKSKIPGLPVGNLLQIPERVAIAMQDDGWILRDRIIWHKPSHMPTSAKTRTTNCYEFVYLFTKKPNKYYYDWLAIAESTAVVTKVKNARNLWVINPQPYRGAHFAVMPNELVRRCVAVGTSEKGYCYSCGLPWVRKIKTKYNIEKNKFGDKSLQYLHNRGVAGRDAKIPIERITTGWQASCNCRKIKRKRRGIVLDPFAGAGTTGLIANKLGRRAILCELNPEYVKLARQRLLDHGVRVRLR